MNRRELIAALSENVGCTKVAANKSLSCVIEIITSTLKGGDAVYVDGLGTFKVGLRSARKIRHPRTGETLKIPASTRLMFVPSSKLSKAVKSESS